MNRRPDGDNDESPEEYWARECPGQFLYVITFGPPPRRRRKKRRPVRPVAPSAAPSMLRQAAPPFHATAVKQLEDA